MIKTAPAYRAYLRRFVPVMLLYVVLVWAAPALIHGVNAQGPLLWLIASAPALPLAGVFWLIGRLLIDLDDEYLRMLEVRKALVATGFAMTAASVWGFLEVYAEAPHVPLFAVPILWFAGLGLGSLVNLIVERK